MSTWPGRWHSKVPNDGDGVSFTNDHGIRWLSGEGRNAWLKLSGEIPENRC